MPQMPSPPASRTARLWYTGFSVFLALSLIASIYAPPIDPSDATTTVLAIPEPATSDAVVAPAGATMYDAVREIELAAASYREVRDYTCKLVQRERVGGVLPPESVMVMHVRTEPFAVHLRWLEPRSLQGQEAIFGVGLHQDKMRVRSAGLLGAVGFISLAVDDARAKATSRHAISEAGIGNLIERFGAGWPKEARDGITEVHLGDFICAGRPCTRIETIHATNPDERFLFSKSVLFFDQQSHLPIRLENYGWPSAPGTPGELLEEYSYLDMRLNVGLPRDEFAH